MATGQNLQGSSPAGLIGVNVYSYDNTSTLYSTNCVSGVAPLERIGIAVSIDKASHTSSMHVYGRTGSFDTAFRGVLTFISDSLPTENDVEQLATPLADSFVMNEAGSVSANIVYRIPESMAGTTLYISFVFKFVYEIPAAESVTGYVVVPVSITVNDFEPENGSGKISLVSVEDQNGNDVSKAVCLDLGPTVETVTYIFNYDDPNPENYLFIPVISEEVPGDNRWQEQNSYVNNNLAELESPLIISSDSDFTGGNASLVLNAALLQLGKYCVGAIAKFTNVTLPDLPGCPVMTVDVLVSHSNWTGSGFILEVDLTFNTPAGYVIAKPAVYVTLIPNSASVSYLETSFEGAAGNNNVNSGPITVVDNDPTKNRQRFFGEDYRVFINFQLLVTESVSSETCAFVPVGTNITVLFPSPVDSNNLATYNGSVGSTNFALTAI